MEIILLIKVTLMTNNKTFIFRIIYR